MLTPRRGFLSASGYLALGLGAPAPAPPAAPGYCALPGGLYAQPASSPGLEEAIQELCARIYREGSGPTHVWFPDEETAAKWVQATTGLPYDEALRRVRERATEEPCDDL